MKTMTVKRLSDERRRLVEENVDMVSGIAAKTLPGFSDVEQKISHGYVGLIDAAIRFDESRGVKFRTFARARVRGSIIDGFRSSSWCSTIRVPRNGASVVGDDMASRLRHAAPLSTPTTEDGRVTLLDVLALEDRDPLGDVDGERLWKLVATYGRRTLAMFEGYYRGGITMREIGRRLGVSESRVSQTISTTLADLRRELERRGGAAC